MLYMLHKGNNPGLTYHGGQAPIVHLVADLKAAVEWAEAKGRLWAFSRGNAGAYYAEFFNEARRLNDLNWDFISRIDWRDPDVKEAKQAELLIEGSFPWELIEIVGVMDRAREQHAAEVVRTAAHQPGVRIERSWYY